VTIDIRPITDAELTAWQRHTSRAFAGTPNDERVERYLRPNVRLEDTLAAFDGGEIVGTAHHEPAPITLPGGAVLPCAGVTRVSVAPTHRRQGILTRMMKYQLKQARDAGNPLAALWASEAPIYGRFGYGLASVHEEWSIERDHSNFAWWAPEPKGRVRFLRLEDAREIIQPMFDAYASTRPGGMPRICYRWESFLADETSDREGASPLNLVLYEPPAGEPTGYVAYRMKGEWPDRSPEFKLEVQELVALDAAAEAGLWRYLFGIDLVGVVTAPDLPADAALPWLVSDFRRLKRVLQDGIYLRILDVPRALGARTYGAIGRLVLQVDDPTCDWADGRYVLEAGDGGVDVDRTEAEPDLVLHPAGLATLLLGTETASLLARAGLIEERTPGALLRADAMFASPTAPHSLNHF
jgi:predicted acetyltransferase